MTGGSPAGTAARPGVVMVSLHTSPLAQPGSGDAGGLNVYVRHLALALRRLGHPVWILTRQDSPGQHPAELTDEDQGPDDGPAAWVLPVPAGPAAPMDKSRLRPWVEQFAAAGREALERAGALGGGEAVVVHSHYWLSGLAAERLSGSLGAPWVHTMHTLAAVKRAQDPQADEGSEREAGESRIAREADALVANTPAERQDLVRHAGAAPDRIVVVAPGVDTAVFSPEGPAVWPGAPGRLRVLFAGRIQTHKGPQVAVQALGELRRALPAGRSSGPAPVALHVTGAASGSGRLDLQAVARQAGVQDWCTVSEPLSPPELAAAYRAADVVVMPSRSESFGLVALEAQACGTPVLAHRVGGLVHAVQDGATGRLLPDLDPGTWAAALRQILDDPQAWTDLGPAAARRAQEFGWDRMARTMSGLYTRLSVRGPRSSR